METNLKGRVWVFGDSINTDLMMPGFSLRMPVAEAARYVFDAVRPGWADAVVPGDVIVAGKNCGIGSSRPVPLLLLELGIAAIIAEEFNSLFFRNCINYGFPALAIDEVGGIFREGDEAQVDLLTATISNRRTGEHLRGRPYPRLILEVLTAGGITAQLRANGYLSAEVTPQPVKVN